jgi:hypothetical protein
MKRQQEQEQETDAPFTSYGYLFRVQTDMIAEQQKVLVGR